MPSYAYPPPPPTLDPTPIETIDAIVERLASNKERWAGTSIDERIRLLDELRRRCDEAAEEWVRTACQAKGHELHSPAAGEEWLGGPTVTLRNMRLLAKSLREVRDHGHPLVPSHKISQRPDGRVVVEVFPTDFFDKVLIGGMTAETWMEPDITPDNLTEHMAGHYRNLDPEGKVSLVLGAGNVSSIAPMDALQKLFVENEVVCLKMNPVNEYLGPIFRTIFAPLVDQGYFDVVYGGVTEGAHLTSHPKIDTIHITGSDATHDAIVWGPRDGRDARKASGDKQVDKPITSELGNVTPLIVVPGPWTDRELQYQAENVATMVCNNASFNCNAGKLLILPAQWELKDRFVEKIKAELRRAGPRKAYYPGARERWRRFLEAHPDAEVLIEDDEEIVPWTYIAGLDPNARDEICFTQEPFCGVLHEVQLPGDDAADFLDTAVAFCNDRVWGTLACMLLIHPKTRQDPTSEAAFQRALDDLRYGGIAVNQWAGWVYGLVSTTWGAHPGHTLEDIGSGKGAVHNTYLFDRPQKSIVYAPFVMFPKPPLYVTHSRAHEVGKRMARMEASPSIFKIPGIAIQALFG